MLVVFDSCYSRNATRSIAMPRGVSKAAALFGPLEGFADVGSAEPYPYHNVVSMTAASEAEQAMDIGYAAMKDGLDTIDGRPKGSLTDALLRGLRGDADSDGDHTVTLSELFQFVRGQVMARFSQTPQLVLPDDHPELARSPIFNRSEAPSPVPASAAFVPAPVPATPAHALRIRLDRLPASLVSRLTAIDGIVAAATGGYDVRLSETEGMFRLYDQSGDALQDFPVADVEGLLRRIQRERFARQLLNLAPPQQAFNVRVEIPSPVGVLQSRKSYTLICDTDVPAALLVLNIDKEGIVSVLVPRDPDYVVSEIE